jgi:hypothetical protein
MSTLILVLAHYIQWAYLSQFQEANFKRNIRSGKAHGVTAQQALQNKSLQNFTS